MMTAVFVIMKRHFVCGISHILQAVIHMGNIRVCVAAGGACVKINERSIIAEILFAKKTSPLVCHISVGADRNYDRFISGLSRHASDLFRNIPTIIGTRFRVLDIHLILTVKDIDCGVLVFRILVVIFWRKYIYFLFIAIAVEQYTLERRSRFSHPMRIWLKSIAGFFPAADASVESKIFCLFIAIIEMCDVIFFDISFTRECVGFRVLSAFDHFNMSIAVRDDALAAESQREFEEDFKKNHDGKTFSEWCQECAFKSSPEYKKNQDRALLPDDFKIAGHFLGELIPPAEFAKRFGKSVFYVRETNTRLSEKFLGVFSRIGIVTNSIGRVSRIVLASDIMARAEQALEKYKVAREFLLSHGIDDYYEESIGKAQEIQDYYEPEGNCWAQRDFCALKWIDKSRSVWIELALHVSKTDGMKIYLEVKHVAQDSWTDYQWRRGLDKIRNGKRQE